MSRPTRAAEWHDPRAIKEISADISAELVNMLECKNMSFWRIMKEKRKKTSTDRAPIAFMQSTIGGLQVEAMKSESSDANYQALG